MKRSDMIGIMASIEQDVSIQRDFADLVYKAIPTEVGGISADEAVLDEIGMLSNQIMTPPEGKIFGEVTVLEGPSGARGEYLHRSRDVTLGRYILKIGETFEKYPHEEETKTFFIVNADEAHQMKLLRQVCKDHPNLPIHIARITSEPIARSDEAIQQAVKRYKAVHATIFYKVTNNN